MTSEKSSGFAVRLTSTTFPSASSSRKRSTTSTTCITSISRPCALALSVPPTVKMLEDCITLTARPTRRDGALHLVPGGAALHRDGHAYGIDREDPVEPAHVQHHPARGVGVASLAVPAAGDRDLQLPRPGVPQDGLELLHLPGVGDALDPRGCQPGDVGDEQRVVGPEQLAIGDDKGAGVQDEGDENRGERRSHPDGGGPTPGASFGCGDSGYPR